MVANQGEILAAVKDTEDPQGSQAEPAGRASLTRSHWIYDRDIDKFFRQNKQYLIAAKDCCEQAEHRSDNSSNGAV